MNLFLLFSLLPLQNIIWFEYHLNLKEMILAIRGLSQSLVIKGKMCHYGIVPQDFIQMEMQNLGF